MDIGDWRNVFDHWSRRCKGNVIGEVLDLDIELGHVGIDVRLLSRTGDVPVRVVLLSRGGLLEVTAPQVAFRRVVPRPAAPQRPAALLDLPLLARRQLAQDQEVPASPEDSATAVTAVLVTLSFASHQLSNHIPENPLRFSPRGSRCS